MLVYLLNNDNTDTSILFDDIERSISSTEPNRTLAFSRPSKRLIVKPWYLSCFIKPIAFNQFHPCFQFDCDVPRNFSQVLLGGR